MMINQIRWTSIPNNRKISVSLTIKILNTLSIIIEKTLIDIIILKILPNSLISNNL